MQEAPTRTPVIYLLIAPLARTETFIAQEIAHLERNGFEVHLACLEDGPQAPELPPATPLGVSSAGRAASLLTGLAAPAEAREVAAKAERKGLMADARALLQFADRVGARHVHAQYLYKTATVALLAKLLGGPGYSVSAHAFDLFSALSQLERKVAGAAFVATCTNFNVAFMRERLPAALHERIHLVYHGVDAERFAPDSDGESSGSLKCVAVGTLKPKKGYPVLLRAMAALHEGGVDASVRVLGGGDAADLLALADELGVADAVAFEGHQSREVVLAALRDADVFVMSSVRAPDGDMDGLPNVVLEAMATGLPVVASDLSAIPEGVRHEQTGLLVPPGDHAALAAALERVAGDTELRTRLGTAARELVRAEFSVDGNNARLLQLMRAAAGDA